MAVKCRGVKTIVNFKLGVYEDALPYITNPQLARVSGELQPVVLCCMTPTAVLQASSDSVW
jgi:hypothetical protein